MVQRAPKGITPTKKRTRKKKATKKTPAKKKASPRKKRSPESKTSARKLQAAIRANDALKLRLEGKPYREISEALGYSSECGARQAVERELQRIRETAAETAEEVRELEIQRLDALTEAYMPVARSMAADPMGSGTKAAGIVIRVGEQRAKLLGLNAPEKHEHSGPGGGPIRTERGPDLSGLTNEELEEYRELTARFADLAKRVEARQAEEGKAA